MQSGTTFSFPLITYDCSDGNAAPLHRRSALFCPERAYPTLAAFEAADRVLVGPKTAKRWSVC